MFNKILIEDYPQYFKELLAENGVDWSSNEPSSLAEEVPKAKKAKLEFKTLNNLLSEVGFDTDLTEEQLKVAEEHYQELKEKAKEDVAFIQKNELD